jgi:23S rRNA (cytosine1962-C5)-methyltransferase
MARVRLKRGHVQPVWAGHPWIYAQAIDGIDGAPHEGDPVEVIDPNGNFLGAGFYSPRSAIPVRIMSRSKDERLDGAAIGRRVDAAARFRKEILTIPASPRDGYRLVHAEGDDLPGLVVDVFGGAAVVQITTAGMDRLRDEIIGHVVRVTHARHVLSAPVDARATEGVHSEAAVLRGDGFDQFDFLDRGFEIQLPAGLMQKTGYYFDQRENRAKVERLAHGRRMLDAFSYVGAFGLAAARGGASEVICLDRSSAAIAAGAALATHHGFEDRMEHRVGDTRKELDALCRKNERFDLVVLDPPKFAPTRKHLEAALRAYRRVNGEGMRLLRDGGVLVTCSCSAAMRTDDFQRILALAAADAKKRLTIFDFGTQAPDHPHPAGFPEGRYLDVVFARVDELGDATKGARI